MNAFSRLLVVAATCLLGSRAALAMDIEQFEAMVEKDQQTYIGDLVWGAAILLEQDCMPQVAAQVRKLFIHDSHASDRENFDPAEGTKSLGDKLVAAGKRAAEHPEQASRIRVDDLLRATLREKGITLPDRFAAIDRAFKPKGPPPAQKPADDGGFGTQTRDDVAGDALIVIVIRLLQNALDIRNNEEVLADKRMRGVCQDAKQSEAETLLRKGLTLLESNKQVEAAAAFQGACDKGSAGGCAVLGELYDKGTGVAKDATRGAALYGKACDGGEGVGCYSLAYDFANGIGVTKDLTRAAALYQQACDSDYPDGCTNLGVMYRNGTGVTKDAGHAIALYQKGCDGKAFVGCFNLGLMYEYGSGVTKDAGRAGALYRRACDGGYTKACPKLDAKAPAPAAPADGTPSVAGYQPSWIGHTMVVRGTVSRFVQKNVNGEPYVYLYFKERPDSTVVACARDDRWLLGVLAVDNFQSVVGKTLEFNGEVVSQPCAENGASLWIWQRSNARLVGGGSR